MKSVAFLLLLFVVSAFAGGGGSGPENIDLTTGKKPKIKNDHYNMGPTGFRGWVFYEDQIDTSKSRQILVTEVEKGSPADGHLDVDDVILGVSVGTLAPVQFDADAIKSFANAITEAEAQSPARLNLLRWRKGKTEAVTLQLETMGAYSDTAPYNCPKSRTILDRAMQRFYEKNENGSWGYGALILLAGADPKDPHYSQYVQRAKAVAHSLIPTREKVEDMMSGADSDNGKIAWKVAYSLIVLAEYYLKTGDEAVRPALEAYALAFAKGQSWFGTTGHLFASPKPDGSPNGPMGGYGPINASGVAGFLGLVLAREAGIRDPAIAAAIQRGDTFFGYYAFKGGIPYGEQRPGMGEMNGKCGMAALAFELQPDGAEKAKFFARMTSIAAPRRDLGHAGPFLNHVFPPLGAAVASEKLASHYFKQARWKYELARRWDGGLVCDVIGGGNQGYYSKMTEDLATILTYALPLRQIHLTGRDRKPACHASPSEIEDTIMAEDFDAAGKSTKELVQALSSWSPQVRLDSAKELANRPEDMNIYVPMLHQALKDPRSTFYLQSGILLALGIHSDPRSLPILADYLDNPDVGVRYWAIQGLRFMHDDARLPLLEKVLKLAASSLKPTFPADPDDPIQFNHAELCNLLFYEGSLDSRKGMIKPDMVKDIDRKLLHPAILSVMKTPSGHTRGTLKFALDCLGMNDIQMLASALYQASQEESPADCMFSSAGRIAVVESLAQFRIAEGLPIFLRLVKEGVLVPQLKRKNIKSILMNYSSCFANLPDRQGFEDFLYELSVDEDGVDELLKEFNKNDDVQYLKEIRSVKAQKPALRMPTTQTLLSVDAANYIQPLDSAQVYTWRKVYGPGKVSFSPNADSHSSTTQVEFVDGIPGSYQFEVILSDDLGLSHVSKTIDVTLSDRMGQLPDNKPPRAISASINVTPGVSIRLPLAGTDPEGGELMFRITKESRHGRLSGTPPDVTYTPSMVSKEQDLVSFDVIDNVGQVASGTIDMTPVVKEVGVTAYEPFDYAKGQLNGQSGGASFGWSGNWTAESEDRIDADSLQFSLFPNLGGKVSANPVQTKSAAYRRLSRDNMNRDNMLKDGSEIWLSGICEFRRKALGRHAYLGLRDGSSESGADLHVRLGLSWEVGIKGSNDEMVYGDVDYMVQEEQPLYLLVRCVWGSRAGDLDRVEAYQVVSIEGRDPYVISVPKATISGHINQSTLDTLYFETSNGGKFDEIRVGPTRSSVLLGTSNP